jgi:hypothetical protein
MSHLDDGVLLALLDGEIPVGEREAAERHLAECAVCGGEAARLRSLSTVLSGALPRLDRPAAVDHAYREVSRQRWKRRWATDIRRGLPRAAVLLMGVAAVASATLPGSPVRRWVKELWRAEAPTASAPAVPTLDSAASAVEEESAAGVSVLPAGGSIRVTLDSVAPGVKVRVRLSDDRFSDVRASGAASSARFRTSPGRIHMSGASAGEVEIVLPRSARSAVVEVGGRPYLRKEGGGLRLLTPVADSAGSEIVFTVEPQAP